MEGKFPCKDQRTDDQISTFSGKVNRKKADYKIRRTFFVLVKWAHRHEHFP